MMNGDGGFSGMIAVVLLVIWAVRGAVPRHARNRNRGTAYRAQAAVRRRRGQPSRVRAGPARERVAYAGAHMRILWQYDTRGETMKR